MNTTSPTMTGGLLLWVFMILALGGPLAVASMTMDHAPAMQQHAAAELSN